MTVDVVGLHQTSLFRRESNFIRCFVHTGGLAAGQGRARQIARHRIHTSAVRVDTKQKKNHSVVYSKS